MFIYCRLYSDYVLHGCIFILQNIEGIAYRLKQTEGCDVQFALVQYRDHPPQERSYVVRGHDFTKDPTTVRDWLDKARASGGKVLLSISRSTVLIDN